MIVSIIIRTFNEERYLARLLDAVADQRMAEDSDTSQAGPMDVEVVLVDSGSTDRSVEIARARGAVICHLAPEAFSFGRSLNLGCSRATGEIFVFVSGHCIPKTRTWLRALIEPIRAGDAVLSYGRQVAGETTSLSEAEVFSRLYPDRSAVPQDGFFCNNANAAVSRPVWERFGFDEELTGLEDMHLGKRIVESGGRIAYVAEAAVAHYHHETWAHIRRRYEREAIALRRIRPEWHVTLSDFLRYVAVGVLLDSAIAVRQRRWLRNAPHIVMFRLMQYWGSYRGNYAHRQLAEKEKRAYFYPIRRDS
ncbi:MAG TPA: glycosyltransferase [Vicinamibacterales bacterium]|nr:glycosyltransferase [Vicinamibacterales bacterium]